MSNFSSQPFYKHKLHQTGFQAKFLKTHRKNNALLAINNLLAEKKPDEVEPNDIINILLSNYKLIPTRDFPDGSLGAFYKKYLEYCLEDNILSEEEIKQLKHLKYLLCLNNHDMDRIHNEICYDIYEKDIESVLDDDMLDPGEKNLWEKLYNGLQVPRQHISQIKKFSASQILARIKNGIISKNGLNPNDEHLFNVLTENLSIPNNEIERTPLYLELMELLWHCINVGFPNMNVDISLRRGERCLFYHNGMWVEDNTRENKSPKKFDLVKKLLYTTYWKVKEKETKQIEKEKIYRQLIGSIFLTDERIIFYLYNKNKRKVIRLANIEYFTTFSNGIYIYKNRGRNTFIEIEQFAEPFALLLGQALRQKVI